MVLIISAGFRFSGYLTCSLWRGFISAIVVKMLKKKNHFWSFFPQFFCHCCYFLFSLVWFSFFFRTSHYFLFLFQKLLLTGWIFLKKNCNASIIWELLKFIQPDYWSTALLIGVIHIKERTRDCCMSFESLGHERLLGNFLLREYCHFLKTIITNSMWLCIFCFLIPHRICNSVL